MCVSAMAVDFILLTICLRVCVCVSVSVSVSVSMCLCYSDDVQLYLADHFDDSYLLLVRIFAVLMTTLYICNVCTQGAYVVYVNTVYTHSKL